MRINRGGTLGLILAAVGCWAWIGASVAGALPGDLDLGFDGDGKVVTDFGSQQAATDVAIQADGKIVAVGLLSGDFTVARYNPDGSLDPGFDGDGEAETSFGSDEGATSVAIQSDGKIVAAGLTKAGSGPANFALVRYNSDGSLDQGFDNDGELSTNFGGDDAALALALQSDGKIVAAGISGHGVNNDFVFARYNADGSLDPGFDGDGRRRVNFGGNDAAYDVAVQANGAVLAVGLTVLSGDPSFALARLNPNGTPDLSFDTDGRVITDPGDTDTGSAVAIQPDGRIVAAGTISSGLQTDLGLIRYNADGSLDPSFGGDGIVTHDFGDSEGASDIAIQPDGKLLVSFESFVIGRFTAEGALDPGFGGDGAVAVDFGSDAFASSIALQPDGMVVAAGGVEVAEGTTDFGLARLEGGEPLAPPPPPAAATCKGRTATIEARPRKLTRGTARADVIVGTPSNDRIRASGGRDLICAGTGNDLVDAGAGRDTVRGGRGNDRLMGGGGDDVLAGGPGRGDRCAGGPGRDRRRSC